MQKYFEKIKEGLEESGKIMYRYPTVEDPPGYSLIQTGEKDILVSNAIEIVNQVEKECRDKFVSIGTYKQVAWERDIAIEQLHELEYEFGQKIHSSDGWIPCSEKTPEFEIYAIKRMWVTMHKKGCGFHFSRQLRWNGCMGRWEWENGKTVSDGYEIVAWKPVDIPAPYQPKGE